MNKNILIKTLTGILIYSGNNYFLTNNRMKLLTKNSLILNLLIDLKFHYSNFYKIRSQKRLKLNRIIIVIVSFNDFPKHILLRKKSACIVLHMNGFQ